MSDNSHYRYRGEDLERYRAALYAQWIAERDGIAVPDEMTRPNEISIDYDANNRVKAVIFYGNIIDVRVRLP